MTDLAFNAQMHARLRGRLWYVQADMPHLLQRLNLPEHQAEFVLMLPRDYQRIEALALSSNGQELLCLHSPPSLRTQPEYWQLQAMTMAQTQEQSSIQVPRSYQIKADFSAHQALLIPPPTGSPHSAPQILIPQRGTNSELLALTAPQKQERLSQFTAVQPRQMSLYLPPDSTQHRLLWPQMSQSANGEQAQIQAAYWYELNTGKEQPMSEFKALRSFWFRPQITALKISPRGRSLVLRDGKHNNARLYLQELKHKPTGGRVKLGKRQELPPLNLLQSDDLRALHWSPCERFLAYPQQEGLWLYDLQKQEQSLLPRLRQILSLAWTE